MINYEKHIRKLIKSKRGTVDKTWIYEGCFTKFFVTCENGHIFETCCSYIQQDHWCRYCKNLKIDADVVRNNIEAKGYVLEEDWEYINSKTKFLLTCNKNKKHKWKTNWNKINAGHGCPYCRASNKESMFRHKIENYFGASFPTRHPKWLQGLELDGYNKKLKIAFEYQGEQHSIKHFYNNFDNEKLIEQIERDCFKEFLCKEKGVKLIVISHDTPIQKWKRLIKKVA